MYIIFDLGTVLFIILIFVLFIAGGIASLLEFVLAHLVACSIAFLILGLIVGIFISFLKENKLAWFSTAITTPCVYMFPLLIVIPYYVKEFKDSFIGTLVLSPITFFIMAMVFMFLWIIHFLASFGIGDIDDEDERSPLGTLLSGVIVAGIQAGVIALLYYRWIV